MDLNTLLKYGGTADVIIRAAVPQTIGSKALAKDEPYTFIKNIPVSFNYSKDSVAAEKVQTLVNYNQDEIYSVSLGEVPLTGKIVDLIFDKRLNAKIAYSFTSSCENHRIYLHHSPVTNLFVYDSNNNLVGSAKMVQDNYIEDPILIEGADYLIFYDYVADNDAYGLYTPNRPYFTLDIFAQGNSDDQSSTIFFRITPCSLLTSKDLYFDNNINTTTIAFKVMTSANQHSYMITE